MVERWNSVKQDIGGEEALALEETACKHANPKKGLAACWIRYPRRLRRSLTTAALRKN
jgi:hypothetical protein